MWSRSVAAAGLLLGLGAFSTGQSPAPYSRAVPPDAAALARLNLRTEWSQYLPIGGGRAGPHGGHSGCDGADSSSLPAAGKG